MFRHLPLHRHRYPHAFVLRVHRLVVGGALLVFGAAELLVGQGVLTRQELWLALPAVIAWSGAVRLAVRRSLHGVAGALLRFAVAAYLVVVIEHLGGWTLAATWPVLLIAAGIGTIAHALAHRDMPEEPTW